jgi:FkbM family methyltransferase
VRFKDHFWVKTIKWHLYKNRYGNARWRADYLFDCAVRRLRPGDAVVDCGANIGLITLRLAARGAEVHAFEPDPYSFARLREATASLKNVKLYNTAVGITADKVRLYRATDFDADPEFNSLSSSVFADKKNINAGAFIEVEQIDLLDFLNKLDSQVRILKLDVEGAEVPIIEKIISSGDFEKIDAIFAETHEKKVPQLTARTIQLRELVARKHADRINLDWV